MRAELAPGWWHRCVRGGQHFGWLFFQPVRLCARRKPESLLSRRHVWRVWGPFYDKRLRPALGVGTNWGVGFWSAISAWQYGWLGLWAAIATG